MEQRRFRKFAARGLAVCAMFSFATTASANFYELLRRVPDSANTLILIDVEQLLMSPIAIKEHWREKAKAGDRGTLHFPINAERYLLASKLDLVSNFENIWDAALIETTSPVSLPYLAKAEGGYLDKVEGLEVAFSRRNAFMVGFKPDILGVAFPANRQDLARWLKVAQKLEKPAVSDYLQKAVTQVHGKDQVVIAFDFADLLGPQLVRDRLHQMESLAGKKLDMDTVTRVLSSLNGINLSVQATDRLTGRLRVDFGESPAPIKEIARGLILEVLEKNGVIVDEMRDWSLVFEAKALVFTGKLNNKTLRKLTGLIPFPADTLDLKGAESKNGSPGAEVNETQGSTADAKATTSKKYFRRIEQILTDLRADARDAAKPKFAQMMVDKAAREIDRLSVLNVDEELVAFGSGVSSTLRNMRNLSKNAQLDYNYRKATMAGQQGDGYGYGGFYGGGTNVSLGNRVVLKQEEALLQSNELAVFTMLQEKSAEVRKKMTIKYQVDF